jgi:lysophospholipase L1-like esterase
MKRLLLAALAAIIVACATTPVQPARASDWVESWSAAPHPPSGRGVYSGPAPSWRNRTIREVVRLSAGGSQLRVRLTNEYSGAPLAIGAATIAIAGKDGVLASKPIALTFSGRAAAVIRARAPLVSDPVDLPTKALQSLTISLYLPEETGPCTCHITGVQTAYVSAPGDYAAAVSFPPAETLTQRAFLAGVDVLADGMGETIVALGDSITDGDGATVDADNRWPDRLAERLAARGGPVSWGVSNQGLSGNRLLWDVRGAYGESILARLDRDVLSVPGVKYVVVLVGVNDLGFGLGPLTQEGPRVEVTAEAMIAAYRQVIARAHLRGLTVYGGTIIPYGGAAYWSKKGEAVRQAVNEWVRVSREFDGVIDFDAAVRDHKDPTRMAEGMHAPDFLHGSPGGYEAMARAVDLGLFH